MIIISVQFTIHNKFIVKSILLASDMCFPKTKRSKKILGWNEYIQPFLDKSLLWHDIWIKDDRPREGLIANIMRSARAKYHCAKKNCK